MKIHQGDYLIIANATGKNKLVKCTHEDNTRYKGKVSTPRHKLGEDAEVLDFGRSDVVCNLGKSPNVGSAFGVKIEPLVKVLTDPFFSEIHSYIRVDEKFMGLIEAELKTFRIALKKQRLTTVRPILELRARQGKYAGYYRHTPKEDHDTLCVRPGDDLTEFQYVLAHEYGHAVWFRMMSRGARLRWVKLYHEYITLFNSDDTDLRRVLDEVVTVQSISSAFKNLEEDDVSLLKACVKHISSVHGLNKSHIDMMLEAGENIDDFWPVQIELSEKELAVTDYAKVSPEELFAESFAHWFIGRKLPKAIQDRLDKTMSNLIKVSV